MVRTALKKILHKHRNLLLLFRRMRSLKYSIMCTKVHDLPAVKKYVKIVGFVICYNEAKNGRLEECLTHLKTFCDDIVFCDNSSTDNSLEIAKRFTSQIIQLPNEFRKEVEHKQKMLDMTLKLDPDWIMWMDCDEVLSIDETKDTMQRLCQYGDNVGIDSWIFRSYNPWKRLNKYRVDEYWNIGWFIKLWKNTGSLRYNIKEGLHKNLHPMGLDKPRHVNIKLMHLGFSTEEYVNDKYNLYKSVNQTGYALERIKDETTLKLKDVPLEWYPQAIRNKLDHYYAKRHD